LPELELPAETPLEFHNPHESGDDRLRWEKAYRETRRGLRLRRWRIRRLVDADKEGLLLDLGCGDGLNLGILKELGFQRMIGFDYSVELLLDGGWRPALAGDGQRLPFAADSFETIFVDSVLHHFTDYLAAASEMARVLRPGGRLFYMEPRPGVGRRFFDWLTFSTWAKALPFFASRNATLLEEWDLYTTWLEKYQDMERHLEASGLRRRYRKKGPIGIFLSYEKSSAAAP
jgi:SAM-dependent methyltransferase